MMDYLSLFSRRTLQVSLDRLLLKIFVRKNSAAGRREKICLLRLDGLGDVVLFVDALRAYRELFRKKDHEITFITEDWIAPLFEGCHYLDRLIGCDTKRFKKDVAYRFRVLSEIKKSDYGVFINSCINRELLYGDIMAHASAAKHRFGFYTHPKKVCEKVIGDHFYTTLVPLPSYAIHEIERNAKLVCAVGDREFRPAKPVMEWLRQRNKRDYFMIAPGAKDPVRRWPVARFAALARMLYKELQLRPVIVGAKGDSGLAASIMSDAPEVPFDDKTGKLDLRSFAGALSEACFIISNDSGPMHLGIAVGTKAFVIASGNSFTQYLSYPKRLGVDQILIHQADSSCFDCQGDCPHNSVKNSLRPCIENISVEQVAEIVLQNLKASA
jgi:ADP-heptose:LPS heptosyltransferase